MAVRRDIPGGGDGEDEEEVEEADGRVGEDVLVAVLLDLPDKGFVSLILELVLELILEDEAGQLVVVFVSTFSAVRAAFGATTFTLRNVGASGSTNVGCKVAAAGTAGADETVGVGATGAVGAAVCSMCC